MIPKYIKAVKKIIMTSILVMCTLIVNAASYNYQNGVGIIFSWDESDISCVYTPENDRIKMWVSSLKDDNHTAIWTGYGWALSSDNEYYAYFPYNPDYVINGNYHTALPISYIGQLQNGNGSTAHLSAFDYLSGQATSGASDCNFTLNHLSSVLRLSLLMPEDADIKSVTLSSNDDVFTKSATMDITNNAVTPEENDKSIVLDITNTTVAAGDSLVAYIMLSPTLLSYADISATVETQTQSYKADFKLPEMKAGYCYNAHGDVSPTDNSKNSQPAKKAEQCAEQEVCQSDIPASSSSIAAPTAFVPDFRLSGEDITAGVVAMEADDGRTVGTYLTNGIKQDFSKIRKGQIYISNGKKHIK